MNHSIHDEEMQEIIKEIGDVLLISLKYELCSEERLESALKKIQDIADNQEIQELCENQFKMTGSQYTLFYFSNIIYNLKTKSSLCINGDVLIWLTSVWKNFIQRNRVYQNYIKLADTYEVFFRKFFGDTGSFITRLSNVNKVSDHFLQEEKYEGSELNKLEKFYTLCDEIASVMKPSYFFFIDLAKEIRIETGEILDGAFSIEKNGIAEFGAEKYNYRSILENSCRSLALLEAVYLLLKKKKGTRQFRILDGKKKFVTTSEIYEFYSEKFDVHKKDLVDIK